MNNYDKIRIGLLKANPLVIICGTINDEETRLEKTAMLEIGYDTLHGKANVAMALRPLGFPLYVRTYEFSIDVEDVMFFDKNRKVITNDPKTQIPTDILKEIKKLYYKELSGLDVC